MYQPINSLNIPENKLKELQKAEYYYCKDVDAPIPYWDNSITAPKTKTALDIYNDDCRRGSIQTFLEPLDVILGGGIPLGQITEFCGEPGSGKTQLCFQLCVTVQLPAWCGGLNGEAVYIGTNSNFASNRVKEIAVKVINHYELLKTKHSSSSLSCDDLNVNSIVERISYIKAEDHVQLLAVIAHLNHWIREQPMVKLVVIDSICAPLKLLDGSKRTAILYQLLQDLQKLADEYNFAIVLTNDITTRFKTSGARQTPSLGDSYYHRLNNRVYLEKKSLNVFKAVVLKNVFGPQTEVEFRLLS